VGIEQNANTYAHITLALYDGNGNFLESSNQATISNTADASLYFSLSSAVQLAPNTTYYVAIWSDMSIFMSESSNYNALCYYGLNSPYGQQGWPTTLGAYTYECSPSPVAVYGCTIPTPPSSGISGGNAVNENYAHLTPGAVAGLVIGCVLGSNLLLIFLLYCCCVRASPQRKNEAMKPSSSDALDDDTADTVNGHGVELAHASQTSSEAS